MLDYCCIIISGQSIMIPGPELKFNWRFLRFGSCSLQGINCKYYFLMTYLVAVQLLLNRLIVSTDVIFFLHLAFGLCQPVVHSRQLLLQKDRSFQSKPTIKKNTFKLLCSKFVISLIYLVSAFTF